MFKMTLIGAGKLGKAFTKALLAAKLVEVVSVINSSFKSSERACESLGLSPLLARKNYSELAGIQSDITFIATPDDALFQVAKDYAPYVPLQSFVAHASGVHPASILNPLPAKLASVHLVKSVSHSSWESCNFTEAVAVIEGSEANISPWKELCLQLGMQVANISAEKKALYHAALAMGCNHLVGLYHRAQEVLAAAGVENQLSATLLTELMQEVIKKLQNHLPAEEVLTGPMQRGDVHTVDLHLQALRDMPQHSELYRHLAKNLLPLVKEEYRHLLAPHVS